MKKLSTGIAALTLALSSQIVYATSWWNDVKNDRVNSINEAIEKGQDPNVLSEEGHPAIIYAVREDSKNAYMALANNPKTNVNIVNRFGETPLMYAAIKGDIEFAKALIQRGAQVNRLGWAPLHYAAASGQTQMVKLLLEYGAFPNAPAAEGSSPLLLAVTAPRKAESVRLDVVKLLLNAGADPKAVNQQRKSALDVAKEMKLSDIVAALEGAK